MSKLRREEVQFAGSRSVSTSGETVEGDSHHRETRDQEADYENAGHSLTDAERSLDGLHLTGKIEEDSPRDQKPDVPRYGFGHRPDLSRGA